MVPIARLLVSVLVAMHIAWLDARPCTADDDILWSQHPIRVDRSKQTYERLPPLQREIDNRTWVTVPARITVQDSTGFSFEGKAYRIAGIHPIGPKRICKDIDGNRWSCGRAAAVLLGNLVRGKRLLCEVVPGEKFTTLRRCQSGRRDIAAEIVSNGFGRSKDDDTMITIEQLARRNHSGIWRNPACIADFDRC